MAGVKPDDVDVLEAYDSFTITALLHLEDLGFCAKGEGGPFVMDGKLGPGGALPTNTNGGGLSYTHPGMYGMFLIVEAVRQLRGDVRRPAGAPAPRWPWRTARAWCCRAWPRWCSARRRPDERRDERPTRRRSPRVQPPVTEGAEGFWEATREQRYVLQWCRRLRRSRSSTRGWCARAASAPDARVRGRPADAARSTRSPSSTAPQNPAMRSLAPYAVALVDLEEGVRVLSNVVDCAPDDVTVGLAVRRDVGAARRRPQPPAVPPRPLTTKCSVEPGERPPPGSL